jgi:outer membrane protein TolC
LRRAREAIEKLHLAGEVSTPERASVRRTLHARQHAAMETERAAAETEIELLHHLGLRPGARIETAFTLAAPPPRAPAPLDPRRLTAHPRVVAALARHDAGEAGLDAEIRRQYPALTLGPAAGREEGLNRLGLVAGLTLPLWNRNRKGIAEATRAESLAHQEALETWRALVTEAARTHATLTHLLAHPSLPPSEKREADLLADAGELTPLDYFTVREELLDQKLSELEWKRDVALTLADYSKLTQGEEK